MKDHVFNGRPPGCSVEHLVVHLSLEIGLQKGSEVPVVGSIGHNHVRDTMDFKSIPLGFDLLRPAYPNLFHIQVLTGMNMIC